MDHDLFAVKSVSKGREDWGREDLQGVAQGVEKGW